MLDIRFIPESPDEQFDYACQQVANMMDDEQWAWLKCRIADEHLSWPQIFDLVAANS